MNYAGFWLRFVAVVIDGIILGAVQWLVLTPILAAIGIGAAGGMDAMDPNDPMAMMGALAALFSTVSLIGWVINILYFTLMESSKYQATIGKLALSLKVTDTGGAKLDFVKALVRNLCKIISSMILLIGYIMAGFTEKKQALHDMIAGTLVVKK